MAIVRDYITPEGCHIKIDNACYKDRTPEETKKILDRVSELVLREEFVRYVKAQRNENIGKSPEETQKVVSRVSETILREEFRKHVGFQRM